MSAPAFTPGPWSVLGQNLSGEFEVIAPSRETVCVVLDDEERAEADARLIAAAPELYEALRTLERAYVALLRAGYKRITELGGDCAPPAKMEAGTTPLLDARAAIAKADGRE